MTNTVELKQLRLLRQVVEHGSLSAAAAALAHSQPAVSQQIAALERRVGLPLLERTPRGVRPTEAGAVLAGHAEAILERVGLALSDLEAIAQSRGGRVRLAAFPTAGAAITAPAATRFLRRLPEVALSVIEAEPEDSIPMLRAGELDLAVVAERRHLSDPFSGGAYERVEVQHLLNEEMFALLPHDHRLAGRRALRIEQLADEPQVELSRGSSDERGPVQLAMSEAAASDARVVFQSDDPDVVQAMVAAGAGVAIVPGLALVNPRDDIVYRSLSRSVPGRSVAVARSAGAHLSPAAETLLETVHEVGRERHRHPQPLR
jgi:DNA-binding transcriptional LysR family regulator